MIEILRCIVRLALTPLVDAWQRVNDEIYSARIGSHYRAIGVLDGDTMTWTWVGTHEEYNRVIHRR